MDALKLGKRRRKKLLEFVEKWNAVETHALFCLARYIRAQPSFKVKVSPALIKTVLLLINGDYNPTGESQCDMVETLRGPVNAYLRRKKFKQPKMSYAHDVAWYLSTRIYTNYVVAVKLNFVKFVDKYIDRRLDLKKKKMGDLDDQQQRALFERRQEVRATMGLQASPRYSELELI